MNKEEAIKEKIEDELSQENPCYTDWLSDNLWNLREDFCKDDEGFKELYPYGQDCDTDRANYIEDSCQADEFSKYCKEAYKNTD